MSQIIRKQLDGQKNRYYLRILINGVEKRLILQSRLCCKFNWSRATRFHELNEQNDPIKSHYFREPLLTAMKHYSAIETSGNTYKFIVDQQLPFK